MEDVQGPIPTLVDEDTDLPDEAPDFRFLYSSTYASTIMLSVQLVLISPVGHHHITPSLAAETKTLSPMARLHSRARSMPLWKP